jgi:hypothetical protein
MSLANIEEKRIKELFSIGLIYDGDHFYGSCPDTQDINIHWTEILCDSDDDWKQKLSKIKEIILNRRSRALKNQ